jgi:hypothetical protein
MLFDAIGAINAAGLTTIVNLHANGATHHWTPERMTARVDAPEFRAYKILLSDIATRLRSSSSGPVVLEPVNEPSDVCAAPAFRGVQKKLFAAVRAVAPELPLVATGGCGSMIAGLEALDPGELDAFAPMIFTFHFYEPYLFSHQGAPWMREPIYRALNRVPWPASAGSLEATLAAVRSRQDSDRESTEGAKAEAWRITERELKVYFEAQPDRAYIERWFARVAAWAKRHGVPHERVLLGEFGALRSDGRYVAAQAPDRARYISDVRESAEKFGFPWAFWNLFDGMGLMDDATRAFDPPIIEALGLRLAPS